MRAWRRQSFPYLLLILGVVVVWGVALFKIEENRERILREVEKDAQYKARLYAENSLATIKRLNELLADLRSYWNGDWKQFAAVVSERQANISDIAFQIAVIDADGYLAFSNLAPGQSRTYLGDREHFLVHKNASAGADRLFISRPILGRVSGKWSIQFTRPIFRGAEFGGVLVASISPVSLSAFHDSLALSVEGASIVLRHTGEVVARHPAGDQLIGKNMPQLSPNLASSVSGHFWGGKDFDGVERLYGHYGLSDQGLIFLVAEPMETLMMPHAEYRGTMVFTAAAITVLSVLSFLLALRTRRSRQWAQAKLQETEEQRRLLGGAVEQTSAAIVITDTNGAITFVNAAFERITGYSKSEVLGKNPRLLKSGLNSTAMYEELWSTIRSGGTWRGELRNRKKSGETYWEFDTISPVLDDAGVITHFLAVKEDITSRKDLELELQFELEKNRTFLRSTSDGMCVLDRSGNAIEVSESFCSMLGYTRDEMLGMHVSKWDAGIAPDELHATVDRMFQEAVRTQYETLHRQKAGRVFPVEIATAPLNYQGKELLFCSTRDISLRKRQEQELEAQRRRLSDILEGTNAGTWEWNVQTGEVILNERWAGVVGYKLDELASVSIETWIKLTHPDDLARSDALLHKHFDGETPFYECEARMRHKDGRWIWVLDRGKVTVWTDDGKPLWMFGTHLEIDARKQAELRAQEAEALMQSAINTIGEAFVIYDSNDRLYLFNEKYRQTYATSQSVIKVGASFEEIIRYGLEHGQYPEAIGHEDDWLEQRMRLHRDANNDFIQQLPDGRWLRILERRTPEGYVVGFRVDVTPLITAKQAAEAASIAKSQFLATMSHEIRTPMNGILGMAQMLLQPNLQESDRRDFASTILASGKTLLTLLNDILDLSKVEAGRLELESTAFFPARVLDDVRALFEEEATRKGLVLRACWHGDEGNGYRGDALRLRQMLSNLVSNAIKFTHRGSIEIDAGEIGQTNTSTTLLFSVTDTGIGIQEDGRQFLFQPFSQADSSVTRQFGGTGLGLSIVRSLANLMGGEVGLDSKPGEGSRFWFSVPCPPVVGDAGTVEPGPDRGHFGFAKPVAGRILVVEDNATNRKVIRAMLSSFGLDVLEKEDGQLAVDAVEAGEKIDLVLMDIHMPLINGYDATRLIRQWEQSHRRVALPIIAITADAFAEDRQRCMDAGMDDFLAKPVDIGALRAVLDAWLGHARDSGAEDGRRKNESERAAAATDSVFDERGMLARLGGSRDLAKAVVQSALVDMPNYLDGLQEAVTTGAEEEARRVTHTLKGLLAQIGGVELAGRMSEVNSRLKQGGVVSLDEVRELRDGYADLIEAMPDWLKC